MKNTLKNNYYYISKHPIKQQRFFFFCQTSWYYLLGYFNMQMCFFNIFLGVFLQKKKKLQISCWDLENDRVGQHIIFNARLRVNC
jgi:hypothetical protein